VVLLIAGGLFMFTYKSTQFNVEGFALVLGASFIGGIRWTLTQMLLQKAELGEHMGGLGSGSVEAVQEQARPDGASVSHAAGLQNPIDTMFHLQPLMFLGLFPLFAVFEGTLDCPPQGPSAQQIPNPCSEPSTVLTIAVTNIKDTAPLPAALV
jgi:solute carrier family 35 protein C2